MKTARNDALLLAGLLAAALAAWLLWGAQGAPQRGVVLVTVAGEEYARLPLSENTVLEVEGDGWKNVLVIEGGEADMTEADCPDGICVRHRPISRRGEAIICLPHEVIVTVEEGEEGEVDFIT